MLYQNSTALNEENNEETEWLSAKNTKNEELQTTQSEELTPVLTARAARFERLGSGELFLHFNGKQQAVHLKPCFPWTDPRRYISVRDQKDKEILYLDSLVELDSDSRVAVKAALRDASFVMEIKKFLEVREDFELRVWRVELADGQERSFQTKLDEWPFNVPGGGILIRDVGGDLYHVAKPSQLDAESREQFWAFLD